MSLTAAGGSECERGFVTGSGLTGPVTCWARIACLTRSAWFWGSCGLGRTGFGDKIGGGILRVSCGSAFGFHSLLFFLSNAGFGFGCSWLSKTLL